MPVTSASARSVARGYRLRLVPQQRFKLRLVVEHIGLRESVHNAVLSRNSASTRMVLSSSRRPCAGRKIAANSSAMPRPGDDAVDLVVEVHGAGLRVDVGPSVEHDGLHAVLCQQGRGGDAPSMPQPTITTGMREFVTRTSPTARCEPRSMAPSSVAITDSTTSPSLQVLGVACLALEERLPLHGGWQQVADDLDRL